LFGTWKVRSVYKAVSFEAGTRELVENKLELMGVLEVRRGLVGTIRAGDYNFLHRNGKV